MALIQGRDLRTRWLYQEQFLQLEGAKVALFGLGGVGGVAMDCLWRSGVRSLYVVDGDCFEESNQNRQIGSHCVGMAKVDYFCQNYPGVEGEVRHVDEEWVAEFDSQSFDLVLDAVDFVPAKIAFALHHSTKLLSVLGTAKRKDAALVRSGSIWECGVDPFGKKVLSSLRKRGYGGDHTAIYSTERPQCKEMGSCMSVTGTAGLLLASEALKRLIGK